MTARHVEGAAAYVPETTDLGRLADAVQDCRGCDLFRDTTQAVFGAGPAAATMMLVGEQPGDREDLDGRPFVGPAGRILDDALLAADITRKQVYLTNAVKHFKFTRAAGQKRRIHKTPSRTEVVACRPWLFAELGAVAPDVLVLLGATAAKALMGNDFRLSSHRGEVLRPPETVVPDNDLQIVVSIHPSAVLRTPREERDAAYDGLVADLRFAASLLA
ncbi:uracil-DNA glycosylase [Mycobacterium sp. 852013-50091_SCH5140682]|uniref:UdgX family uracil-DNA binding protein n=1 Tax=Mycobacterium sp. 852013-50091_SCH5140682 TaxID=1834109 RepID=UPI0007EB9838|nr:UdgX family uracil-DNA binding protein [Mycobacterium sp. 852013-50091_SCH5140682]OBC10541.1 uracil-DNA glycosylase [Mycobacterium sp. 852013-50091_SCH5140682]